MTCIGPLSRKCFLILVGDDYEDLELWYPLLRLREAGAEITVAGPECPASYKGKHGYPCQADAALGEIVSTDFAGVIIPGGWMPDKLRRDSRVLNLVREFSKASKVVAAICHGGWIPISAGVYNGVHATGSLGIKDDLINAGAFWEDAACVIDRNFVSSRGPDDLPAFCRGILKVLGASIDIEAPLPTLNWGVAIPGRAKE